MNTFIRFFYEFISIFIDGFMMVIKGIFEGICKMFNFGEYAKLISNYQDNFTAGEKILVTLSVLQLLTSNSFKFVQPLNIPYKLVALFRLNVDGIPHEISKKGPGSVNAGVEYLQSLFYKGYFEILEKQSIKNFYHN